MLQENRCTLRHGCKKLWHVNIRRDTQLVHAERRIPCLPAAVFALAQISTNWRSTSEAACPTEVVFPLVSLLCRLLLQALRNTDQCMRLCDPDALTSRGEPSLALPFCEHPADREERCA